MAAERTTVPVKGAFASKINWIQLGGVALSLATVFSEALPPQYAALAAVGIQAVQSVATVITRTFFTRSVTPESLP